MVLLGPLDLLNPLDRSFFSFWALFYKVLVTLCIEMENSSNKTFFRTSLPQFAFMWCELFIPGQDGSSLGAEAEPEELHSATTPAGSLGRCLLCFFSTISVSLQLSRYNIDQYCPGTISTESFWRVLVQLSLQVLAPTLT